MDEQAKQRWLAQDVWTGLTVLFFLEGIEDIGNYIRIYEYMNEWNKKANKKKTVYTEEVPKEITEFLSLETKAEDINNAVTVGALTAWKGNDYSAEKFFPLTVFEINYPVLRQLFKPSEIITWANSKRILYPNFPFHDKPPTEDKAIPDYLDKTHPRYSPRLAAAVSAWQSYKEEKGKTTKHALEEWVKGHAADFGVTDCFEQVAQVANWKTKGGATKK